MKKGTRPEVVEVSETAMEEIKLRVSSGIISAGDQKIILSILCTYQWLCNQLKFAKLSIRRLKNFFGFSTEKRSTLKKHSNDSTPPDSNLLLNNLLLNKNEQNPEEPPIKKF